ncbi:MAG: energy transducer TonB [Gammaproteobacteria bacterium]|nr:energy transducer TonB [Gammaproteobacteria bacterium]MDG1508472.1 energy transducer TonB [Flavobacteriaceae bacterium]MDG2275894.1 energy transducer TonB [Flavobacteriaceae bacterium]
MAILDTTHKRKSTLLTSVILIAFLWIIFSFGMQYQDPPAEYGIALNFGTTEQGSEKPKNTLVKKAPVKEIEEEKLKEVVEEVSKEIINEEVLSQTEKDAPTIEKPKEVLKKEVPKKVELKEEKPVPKPIPKKPSKNTLKAFENLLKGTTSDSKPTGEGDDDKEGLKGDKKGDPTSTKYYGNTGKSGDSNYNLAGREALGKPIEQPDCQEEGTVVVSIEVDKNGKVIRAVAGVKGTTNSANCLLKPAREAALRTTWNADPNAPSKQKGTIIYKFSLTK